jgi:hypothetical protein
LGRLQENVGKGIKNTARGLGRSDGDGNGPFIVVGGEGDCRKFVNRCVS